MNNKNHKPYKPQKNKVTAEEYMRVMNNFVGGEHWLITRCIKELGVSEPTFRKWGNIYFKVNGNLKECYFIIQDSIEHPEDYRDTSKQNSQPIIVTTPVKLPNLRKVNYGGLQRNTKRS